MTEPAEKNAPALQNTRNHALRIVSRYKGVMTSEPKLTNTDKTTDAPLLGNGDAGVAFLGGIDSMTFILHKNEFWSLGEGRVKAMARMSLTMPGMAGASYSMEQDIARAQVNGVFSSGADTIKTCSWVQADDTVNNRFITRIACAGSGPQHAEVTLTAGNDNRYGYSVGSLGDVLYIDVRADESDYYKGYPTCRVRVAVRVIGAPGKADGNRLAFTLPPSGSCTLVASVMSNYDDENYQSRAVENVRAITQGDIDAFQGAHLAWWDDFYAKSYIEIPDKIVEKAYYASLYLLACCSRAHEAAPGLWGNWVMRDPAWNGDYTLNYNYQTPFFMTFPTNHPELADCYDKPVIDWLPIAREQARQNGWTGAYYRVHIGPLPDGSADKQEWNQKMCGAFCAVNMIMHYYYTRDRAYARTVYPVLRDIAVFWQDYLYWDGKRYVILNDAQHEGDAYPQTNGVMSLGLVRFLFKGAIDISADLDEDPTLREIWKERLEKLSQFPTFTRNNETVFRYTEVGRDWNNGNTIGIQHIYPGSQIGLGSDPELLRIARNTVRQMGRWSDGNGTNTFYPAAARIGYDPGEILKHLDNWILHNTYPNLHIHTGGGGIENLNTVPATVCEMLIQSFQGKIRLFADWPAGMDAKFGDLRAYGGFLVSSEIRGDAVKYIRIISKAGGSLTLANPWKDSRLAFYRNGTDAGTLNGSEICIETCADEIIHIAPEGTPYSAILDMMDAPLSPQTAG